MANSSLSAVNLDFDSLKQDFKTFLQSQAIYRDYDFEGSNINILLDLLSYNTWKNAFFVNQAFAEGFIDSAQLINTIRSHAKELNYVPRSATSAKANVTVTFKATGDNQPYIIQKGQSFSSIVKNESLVFSIPETITVASANTTFTFTTDIYEGTYFKDSYVFNSDENIRHPSFSITNPNVDTSSLTVTVYEDGAVLGDIFTFATSLLDLDENSKVFFLQTSAVTGDYEVIFGDGNVGYKPKENSIILLDYRVSSGDHGNGAAVFNINFDPTGGISELIESPTTVTNVEASSGAPTEDIETTRFNAPRYFQTQERAVTTTDYEILLKTRFPEIQQCVAYGGEQLSPPQYGRVIIAVGLQDITGLPNSSQDKFLSFIRGRCPLSIQPVLIAADFTYVYVTSTIRYNINVTTESIDRIKTLVTAAITDYNEQNLNDFNATFRYSKFINAIDNADPSIISNITDISIYKKFIPLNNTQQTKVFNFAVPLLNNLPPLPMTHDISDDKVLTSSAFTYQGDTATLEDDNNGNIRIVKSQGGQLNTVFIVGRIDYDTGIVQLIDFKPEAFEGDALCIYVRPRDKDVSSNQNVILTIDIPKMYLNIEQVKI